MQPGAQSRFQGVLEKQSSDGSWRARRFSLHKHMFNYNAPNADVRYSKPEATFDLLKLSNVEIVKEPRTGRRVLLLHVDEERRHIFRECEGIPAKPSLEEWAQEIEERIAFAKRRRAAILAKERALKGKKQDTVERKLQGKEDNNPDSSTSARESRGDEDRPETTDEAKSAVYRDRIRRFYQKHNPTKVDEVDGLIAKYAKLDVGTKELYAAIITKYRNEAKAKQLQQLGE